MKTTTLRSARLGFRLRNQTENKSKRTTEWYDSNVERLETFFEAQSLADETQVRDPLITEITTADLRAFIAQLQNRQTLYENHPFNRPIQKSYSPYTIRGIVASLSAFFGWTIKEGLLTRNPMDPIDSPKVPKQIKERFDMDQLERLYKACRQYPESIAFRNESLIRFLIDSAVRAGEVCSLTMMDLELERGRARVHGKGAKDRPVFFGTKTRAALWKYINVHRPPSQSQNLFLTKGGKPIDTNQLGKILRDLGERAGVMPCNPHRFRHTGARLLAGKNVSAFMLKQILGHESLDTSQLYVHLEDKDIENIYRDASPGDHLGW